MTSPDWKRCMANLIDGVDQELRHTAPLRARLALDRFRSRLDSASVARRRKSFERELEAFLQSKPFLRAAARRYIARILPPALDAAAAALIAARRVIEKYKGPNRTRHTGRR